MAFGYCPGCGTVVEMVSIKEAGFLSGVSRGTVYSWIKKHYVHCARGPSGRRLVCKGSLVRPEARDRSGAHTLPGTGVSERRARYRVAV